MSCSKSFNPKLILETLFLVYVVISQVSGTLSFICETDECALCNVSPTGIVTCLVCEYGYQLSLYGECQQVNCSSNMYLDRLNGCQPCDSSCKTCINGSSDGCTSCVETYYQVQALKNDLLSSCFKCPNQHCKICDSLGYCLTCQDGFYLNQTSQNCELCTIPYSLTCKTLNSVSSCINGFQVSEDLSKCQPIINYDSCLLGTYADSSNICQNCIDQCLHCNGPNQCYACKDSFYYSSDGTCKSCGLHCSSCDSQGCKICNSGYVNNLVGSCDVIPSSSNPVCLASQYLDQTINQCVTCEKNCAECDYHTGVCMKCWDEVNYQLSQVHPQQCVKRCADGNYLDISQFLDTKKISRLANSTLNGQKIALPSSVNLALAQCTQSTVSTCVTPAFLPTFCLFCQSPSVNYLGACLDSCPEKTYQMIDFKTSQKRCFKCPVGCLACSDSITCQKCNVKYFLVDSVCMNSGITTGSKGVGVFVAGHWMSACPKGSFLSGNQCLPYLTCQRIKLNIQTQTIQCLECPDDAVSILLPMLSGYLAADIPTPQISYYGKCYETCPITTDNEDQQQNQQSSSGDNDGEDDSDDTNDNSNNKDLFCKTSCPLNKPYVAQTHGFVSKCKQNSPPCSNALLGRYCVSHNPCSSGEYLSQEEIFEDDFNFKYEIQSRDHFCKPCPTGCAECIQDDRSVICTSCQNGYETYYSFNMQDPTSYPSSDSTESIFLTIQCLYYEPTSPPAIPCSQLQGYYCSSGNSECKMCKEINSSCTACPLGSYQDQSTNKCVAFCAPDQIEMSDVLFCYDKPTVTITENYLNNILTVGTTTMNVATTEFNIDFQILSSLHEINFISGSCQISALNGYISVISPLTPLTPSLSLIFSSAISSSPLLMKLLAIPSYSLKCLLTLNFVDNPTHTFTFSAEKLSIQHIARPLGDFKVSPLSGDSLTVFSGDITNWRMGFVSNISDLNIFNYQISIVALNTHDLNVQPTKFILKTITYAANKDLYPTNSSWLTIINTTFSTNLQNNIYNSAYLLLTVTPNLPTLASLKAHVKIPITYSFVKSDQPKNSQKILVAQLITTPIQMDNVLQKQTMIQLADETLLSRGALPIDQELQSNLSFQKQSSALSSMNVPLSCNNTVNCNGNGVCKKFNSNWYSMCQCKDNYTGEQCDWQRGELKMANSILRVYLQTILQDISTLDSAGVQSSTNGFSISQMITLLQIWTAARDTFEKEELLLLMEILKSGSLSRIDGESERVMQVLDNTIDLIRKVTLSQSQFYQYSGFLSEIISTTNMQMVKYVAQKQSASPSSVISPVVINQSNFKGVLILPSALKAALAGASQFSLNLPNDIILKIAPQILAEGDYLEVILRPLDALPAHVQVEPFELQVLLSNPLTITVRNLFDGSVKSVDDLLETFPIQFELPYVLPSTYLAGIKNVSCVYYNQSSSAWSVSGVSKVNQYMADSVQSISCNTIHLSQFSLANIDYNPVPIIPNSNNCDDEDSFKPSQEFKFYFVITLVSTGIVLLIIYTLTFIYVKQTVASLSFSSSENEQSEYSKQIKSILPALIQPDFQSNDLEATNDDDEETGPAVTPVENLDGQEYNEKLSRLELKQSLKLPQNNQKTSFHPRIYLHIKTIKPTQVMPIQKSASILENISISMLKKQDTLQQQKLPLTDSKEPSKLKFKYPNDYQMQNQLIIEGKQKYFQVHAPFPTRDVLQEVIEVKSQTPSNSSSNKKKTEKRRRRRTKQLLQEEELYSQQLKQIPLGQSAKAGTGASQAFQACILNDNLSRISDAESAKSHAQSVDLLHDPSSTLNQDNNNHSYHKQSSNSSDSNSANMYEKQEILTIMSPYLSIMSWKYSFEQLRNIDRVLIQVIIISFVFFSSSFSITYILSASNSYSTSTSSSSSTASTSSDSTQVAVQVIHLSLKTVLTNTAICLGSIELVTWILVAVLGVKRLMFKELCSCFCNCLQTNKAFLSHLWQLFIFIFAFLIFAMNSLSIIEFHSDLSTTKFYAWIISSFASLILNQILEFISLYAILKTNTLCLLSIVKFKRLDF